MSEIRLERCSLRPLRDDDAESIARQANDRNIWRALRDRFPHPYALEDARVFIAAAQDGGREVVLAIDVDGQAVGTVGVTLQEDVERVSGEIGYWLGQAFWGRGIVTEAVRAMTLHVIRQHGLTRVFARTFAWNTASGRVLEKAGYTLEARLRRSAVKDGQVVDELQYAFVPD